MGLFGVFDAMRLRLLLYDFEFWISLMSIGFGIWISNSSLTTSSAPTMIGMLSLTSGERLPWALSFFGLGLIHLISLATYAYHIRKLVNPMLAVVWIVVGVKSSELMGNATPSYIITGVAYAIAYMRVELAH